MRLVRVSLKDFRGVAESTIELDEGVTVVEGPNEVGKSSVAEAIRLIRQYKSTSKHSDIRTIKPVDRDAGPEVTLELTTGPYRLVYRKRWLRQPETELSITEPAPAQITGDEAHDRFLAILDETLDTDLLDALEIVQGASLDQAQLAQVNALHRALGDPGDEVGANDDLMARIEADYGMYFTARGKPTGDHARAPDRVRELEETVAELTGRSTEMDRHAEEHARLHGRVEDLEQEYTQAQAALVEHEQAAGILKDLRSTLDSTQRDLADAERVLDDAVTARQAREQLVAALERRRQERQDSAEELSVAKQAHEQVQHRLTAADERCAVADEERGRLRQQATAAHRQWRARHERQELCDLSERVRRAQELDRRCREADAQVQRSAVDQETVDRLLELQTQLRITQNAQQAAAARVVVRRLGDGPVVVDGADLARDEDHEVSVLAPVDVAIEGVVSVSVRPGTAPGDLDDAVRSARARWDLGLAEAEVTSLEEARDRSRRTRQAQAEGDTARAALESLVDGSTLAELESRVAVLQTRQSEQPEDEDAAALDELQQAADDAEAASRVADEQFTAAQQDRDRVRTEAETVRDRQVRADAAHQQAARAATEADEDLDQARAAESDEAIKERIANAERDRDAHRSAVQDAGSRLRAADPETLEMRLENARQLVDSKQRELQATRDKTVGLAGVLNHLATEGIYDRLTEATAELESACRQADRLQRSAEAVRLLRETMVRHREGAQRKYVAPFKDRIERLGRAVFANDFTVEVSDDLRISHRTLNGRTVKFDSLSAGAREQLGLIGRLACAQLIDGDEGAPVILDDTMGFADPDRLERLNVVLNDVGRTAQVVLLTCQPRRFSALGGAHVVSLASS